MIYIKDILDDNGEFMNHQNIKARYGIETNFLEVLQLRQSLPYTWRNTINNTRRLQLDSMPLNLYDSKTKQNISILNMKAKDVYWILLDKQSANITPKCVKKWTEAFGFEDIDWQHIYKIPFWSCRETELQSFQYKIVNRIIACRHWLFNLKVVSSPLCLLCNEDDTLQHFFVHCDLSVQFRNSFVTWWNNLTNEEFPQDERIILFGLPAYTPLADLFNFCIIFAKWHIYKAKMVSQTPSLYSFLKALKGFLHENI